MLDSKHPQNQWEIMFDRCGDLCHIFYLSNPSSWPKLLLCNAGTWFSSTEQCVFWINAIIWIYNCESSKSRNFSTQDRDFDVTRAEGWRLFRHTLKWDNVSYLSFPKHFTNPKQWTPTYSFIKNSKFSPKGREFFPATGGKKKVSVRIRAYKWQF